MNLQTKAILKELYSKANPKNVEGMKRYGIKSTKTLSVEIEQRKDRERR